MFPTIFAIFAGALPPLALALAVGRTKRVRPLARPLVLTGLLGGVLAVVARLLEAGAAKWTGLDVQTSVAGDTGALVFLFAIVAPLREALRVAAAWPGLRSPRVKGVYDALLFSAFSALGFGAVSESWTLMRHAPVTSVAVVRSLLALPGNLFFAGLWGAALGQSVWPRRPTRTFSLAFIAATFFHALYSHVVFARGEGAMLGALPLLAVMAPLSWAVLREARANEMALLDVRNWNDRVSIEPAPLSHDLSIPPSFVPSSRRGDLSAVRAVLRHGAEPVRLFWLLSGVVVSLGALISGLAATVAISRQMHVNFALVDERSVATMAPVVILAVGAMASFAVSGFVVARASGTRSLFEPAVSSALALVCLVIAFSALSASAAVLVLASAPFAWSFSCAGAWVGLSRN